MAKKKLESEVKAPTKKLNTAELEQEIVNLAKKDVPSAKIGLILKNEYGIPKAKYSVGKINKILAKNKVVKFPEELQNLITRAEKLRVHFTKNAKDQVSKRGLQITEARIRKLAAYFKRNKVIDKNWAYTHESSGIRLIASQSS